jgi:AcrR family transcriptional regulator
MPVKKEHPVRSENFEQLILDIAENVFLERGFALTTTTEIAKRVGCNQALIHYYFRTKDRLFERLFEKKFFAFMTSVSFRQEDNLSFKEIIRGIVHNHLKIISENPKLPFLIISEMTLNPQRFRSIAENIESAVKSMLIGLNSELQKEIAAKRVREISAFDLLLNILSLNLFMFVSQPLISYVKGFTWDEYMNFVKQRGDEIFLTVWRGISLEPQKQ